jgi:5-methyltetrahydropteroyltriglutamate--homocysteine methyltransferase
VSGCAIPAAVGDLPVLPTMGVGSYAAPGWYLAMLRRVRQGELGTLDAQELFEDAVRVVVADQAEAGLDVLSDGELRRQRFVYELYQHIDGLERRPPPRRLGIPGYDTAPSFRAVTPLSAPAGLGVVEEYRALSVLAGRQPTKIALPGPLTFLGSIEPGGRSVEALIEETVRIVRAEIGALVAAGARYVQLDEPLLAHPPLGLSLAAASELVNRCLESVDAYLAVHVCFGNNAGRPFADRRLSRLVESMNALECRQLALEFANREMAEVEVLARLRPDLHVAAGVVDVKSFFVESPDRVAERIRLCLAHIEPERLAITADCGFSALPRHLARRKLHALVQGARIVRRELS